MNGPRYRESGFTLIEVLVALAIFGVVSVLAYQALVQTFDNVQYLDERMARIQSVQRTMRIFGQDFVQSTPRPVRDPFDNTYRPSLLSDPLLDFPLQLTRGGWSNPAGLARGTLQRVAYRIEEDSLVRYHWFVLDPTLANEPVSTVMLENVESIEFRYRAPGGDWIDQWPPRSVSGPSAWRIRPQVVEVTLILPDEGEIRRFFEVAL